MKRYAEAARDGIQPAERHSMKKLFREGCIATAFAGLLGRL